MCPTGRPLVSLMYVYDVQHIFDAEQSIVFSKTPARE